MLRCSRRLGRLFYCLLALTLSATAQNYTAVTGVNVTGADGTKLTKGQICFLGTDAADRPINFQVGGGGQVMTKPACRIVTAGVIFAGFQVANPDNTSPRGVLYRVQVTDGVTGKLVVDYRRVSFSGAGFDFDLYGQSGAPVLPPTGGTVSGPLSVAGNLNVTGALDVGSLTIAGDSVVTLKMPSQYGAVGNGIHDDTAAVQAWLNAIFNPTTSGAGFCPLAIYRVTSQLVVFGAPGMAGRLNSAEGYDRGGTGCSIFYDGPTLNDPPSAPTANGPVLKLVGLNNSVIEHLGINANNKARAGILVTNTSTGVTDPLAPGFEDLASSGVQFKYVVVNGIAGAGSYGFGIGTSPPAGQGQNSELTFDHVGVQGSGSPGSCVAGIKSFLGGNTKNFTLYSPSVNGCQRQLDFSQHGGHVTIIAPQFGNGTVASVTDHSGSVLNIIGGEAEEWVPAHPKFLDVSSGANPGRVLVDGFNWETIPGLDQIVSICQAHCTFRNVFMYGNSPGHPARIQVNNPVPGNGTIDSYNGEGNVFQYAGDRATCDPGGTAPFSSACYAPIFDGSGNNWVDRIRNEKVVGAQLVSKNEFGGVEGAQATLKPLDPGFLVDAGGAALFANGLGFDVNGGTIKSGHAVQGTPCSNPAVFTDTSGSGIYACINGQLQNGLTLLKNTSGVTGPNHGGTHGSGSSFTIPLAVTAGNSILVGGSEFGLGADSLTVALTPSGIVCPRDIQLVAAHTDTLWRCPSVPSGTTGVAGTMTSTDFYIAVALEVTGLLAPASPLNASDGAGNALAGSWSGNAMTPAANREAIIIGFADGWSNNTMAAAAPYTGITESYGGTHTAILSYQTVLSTNGAYTPHGTAPGNTNSIGAIYLGAIRAGADNTLPMWASTDGASTANVSFQRTSHVTTVVVGSTSGFITGDKIQVSDFDFPFNPIIDVFYNGNHGPITVVNGTTYTYPDPISSNTVLLNSPTIVPGTTMKAGHVAPVDSRFSQDVITTPSSPRPKFNGLSLAFAAPFTTLTDASPIVWSLNSQAEQHAIVVLDHTVATRALNVTNLVAGARGFLELVQDSTGGAAVTLPVTGCTWKVGGGGAGVVTLSAGANAIDVLQFIYDGTNCIAELVANHN